MMKIPTIKNRIACSRDQLYRVALAWCSDPMLAEDLVQETIATGISKHEQLRDKEQLFAWLYSILNNNWYRHLRRKRSYDDLDEKTASDEAGPDAVCHELQLVMQVRQAVAILPLVERQVISLVDLEEFSYCDVAKILDIPIGTVMSRLHRARKNLLAKMDGINNDSTMTISHIRRVK
jgi:RNA polymerase sigma-70 factor (ECF subfamily)